MKKFIKACLVAVLVFVIVGIVLLVVAAAGGVTRASLRLFSNQGNLSYGPVRVHVGDGFSVDLAGNHHKIDTDTHAVNEDGTTVIQKHGTYSLNESVTELYVDVNAGDFTLLQSKDDYFYIETDEDEIQVDYESGRLTVERIDDMELIQFGFHKTEDVTIYVPAGVTFDVICIDVGAGDVELDVPLRAKQMELDVDAGNIEASRDVTIENRLEMSVNAGNICIDQLECFGTIEAECDMGNLEIEGYAYNDMDITCNVGNVILDLMGNGQKCTYEIESSVGNVTVNGNEYSGIDNDIILEGDLGAPTVKLSCGVGNIEMDIR